MYKIISEMKVEGEGFGCGWNLCEVFCCNGSWVIKSTNDHSMAGTVCFAREPFGKGSVIGYYKGTLMYNSLFGSSGAAKRYR